MDGWIYGYMDGYMDTVLPRLSVPRLSEPRLSERHILDRKFYSPNKSVTREQGTPLYFLSVFTEDNGSFLIPLSADPM